ncbi:MAG: hypothetical protein LBR40_05075 [Bacilli bacterium]|jgi:cell fate (sporulation/competence/biofilm development) regulator YlbF (YheA/YmcA/DUF963 family)|nr:hypothetical protein [Bacilli bacterium]
MNAAEYKAVQINKIIKSSNEYLVYTNLKSQVSSKYSNLDLERLTDSNFNDEQIKKDPLINKFIEATNKLHQMISKIKGLIEIGV